MRKLSIIALLLLIAALWWWGSRPAQPVFAPPPVETPSPAAQIPPGPAPQSRPDFLPPEAHDTLRLIAGKGPYPHRQDGSVFGNREGHLPDRPRGYYHEFTVETPGAGNRGARRIITGGQPPETCYYTDDHYESFREFACALDGSRR